MVVFLQQKFVQFANIQSDAPGRALQSSRAGIFWLGAVGDCHSRDHYGSRSETGGVFTNEVNQGSSGYRDLHMYEVLAKAALEGKRVFANGPTNRMNHQTCIYSNRHSQRQSRNP